MVDLDKEVSKKDIEFAKQQLTQVNKRVANIKKDVYFGDDGKFPHEITTEEIEENNLILNPPVIVSDCQIAVELSAKILFKSFGIKPVERHDIEFSHDRVSGLLGRLPEDEDFSDSVPRVLFLTQFWERFYQLSKYGIPEENMPSIKLINEADAIRAVQDADFCRDVSIKATDYILDLKGIDQSDLNLTIGSN